MGRNCWTKEAPGCFSRATTKPSSNWAGHCPVASLVQQIKKWLCKVPGHIQQILPWHAVWSSGGTKRFLFDCSNPSLICDARVLHWGAGQAKLQMQTQGLVASDHLGCRHDGPIFGSILEQTHQTTAGAFLNVHSAWQFGLLQDDQGKATTAAACPLPHGLVALVVSLHEPVGLSMLGWVDLKGWFIMINAVMTACALRNNIWTGAGRGRSFQVLEDDIGVLAAWSEIAKAVIRVRKAVCAWPVGWSLLPLRVAATQATLGLDCWKADSTRVGSWAQNLTRCGICATGWSDVRP